jgi:hypothetical protein
MTETELMIGMVICRHGKKFNMTRALFRGDNYKFNI